MENRDLRNVPGAAPPGEPRAGRTEEETERAREREGGREKKRFGKSAAAATTGAAIMLYGK